ncbi:synaptonemal complex protein 1 isoform X3 [Polypterus senegalus]|uniref:synaptonemal complex protein 1 isoform X3 n=1 Tax=Polypterus senegalus TaxID=55291 RepID=UPI00196328D4|nr:synaptonemal complex protein 1 isoform X3 [Polypterus senegalus]
MQAVSKYSEKKEAAVPFLKAGPTKLSNPDPVIKKLHVFPVKETQNVENVGQLYSKLYQEMEKIKRWKVNTEYETQLKEKTIQENKKTIETQYKTIQELHFEIERLGMKLEEVISENKDQKIKNNATRHLCSLLKETFERSTKKMSMYETEREETHQLFIQNNELIQRMMVDFEDLRIEAINEKESIIFKFKDRLQKSEEFAKACEAELKTKQSQVEKLQKKCNENEDELQKMHVYFQESVKKFDQQEEAAKILHEDLLKSQCKQNELVKQLTTAEQSLDVAKVRQKDLEISLEKREQMLRQQFKDKEADFEKLKTTKEHQSVTIKILKETVQSLEASLKMEQQRLKDYEESLTKITLELQGKTLEIQEKETHKKERERKILALEDDLHIARRSLGELEYKLKNEENETANLKAKMELEKSDLEDLKVVNEHLLNENKCLNENIQQLLTKQNEFKDLIYGKESEECKFKEELSASTKEKDIALQELNNLKIKLQQNEQQLKEVTASYNKLMLDKDSLQQLLTNSCSEVQRLENELQVRINFEIIARTKIEELEKQANLLREEQGCLKVNIEQLNLEAENKLELELNNSNLQNDLSKMEKQLKTLETKHNTLKKQFENKCKSYEELQQEIKDLKMEQKKKAKEHAEAIKNLSRDYESKQTIEADFSKEIQKLQASLEEAVKNEKDAEAKCQMKIAEMVALMEKHKIQYDKMLEEKDAELNQWRKKELEFNKNQKLLEQELSEVRHELLSLKLQHSTPTKEKEKTEQNVKEVKQSHCSFNKQPNKEKLHCDKQKNVLMKTPNQKEASKWFMQNPMWTPVQKSRNTSVLKTYKIRTPPCFENLKKKDTVIREAANKKLAMALELDFCSDSSEHADLLSISNNARTYKQVCGDDPFAFDPKIENVRQGQVLCAKSPSTILRKTTVKRIREAGWEAVASAERKRKAKAVEKLFS